MIDPIEVVPAQRPVSLHLHAGPIDGRHALEMMASPPDALTADAANLAAISGFGSVSAVAALLDCADLG